MFNDISKQFCKLCGIEEEIDFMNPTIFCTLLGVKTATSNGEVTTIGDKYWEFFRWDLTQLEKYFIKKLITRLDENDKNAIKAESWEE